MLTNKMSAEVFISYASKDRERILDLVDRLESDGVSVWIDQMSIEGATMWSQEIVSAIRNCKVLVLAISGNSADSKNVVKELALASEDQKNILPVYLESAEIPESMAYQLAGIQRVEFFEGDEEAGQQSVIRALAKLGVIVSEEASMAAAGAPKRTIHGASHSGAGQATKGEGATWVKIAAGVVGAAALAAGVFFLGGSDSETATPLGQVQTNTTSTVEQTPPLAKPVTLDTNRVVVLPFKTIGTSGETADLGYGLVSTLTSKLQPLQNLVVIANESARKFKDTELSAKEIGQSLQVGTIVTGEIQTSGDKVQVNIRIIDANTEALGWGNTFMEQRDKFLDLQNEIATRLASELKGQLNAGEARQLAQKATDNPEADSEYQRGRREWNKRTEIGFQNAIKHFQKAIEIDTNFANAYAGLADTYSILPAYFLNTGVEVMPIAKSNAEKAIQLNPNLAEAYTSLAWIQFTFEYNWLDAEKNFQKSISLNSNYATNFHWYGLFLNTSGKTSNAISYLKKALDLEPTSLVIPTNLSQAYITINESNLAINAFNIAAKINPDFPYNLWNYVRCKKDYGNSIDLINKAIINNANDPMLRRSLFWAYIKNGDIELAKDQMIYSFDNFHDKMTVGFAEMYAALGKYNEALKWIKKGIQAKDTPLVFITINYDFPHEFKSDPRFVELMKSINHPAFLD